MVKKAGILARRRARAKYEDARKKRLGEGSRFKAVAEAAEAGGAKNPEAVAAAVGRKKYGKAKMRALAEAGKAKKRGVKNAVRKIKRGR
jgi:hypothetical protein